MALPNAYHLEWATEAIKAGKHVLLEIPSVANAEEAATLFRNLILSQLDSAVLLEAMHFRFHPAWQKLLSLIDRENIVEVHSTEHVPRNSTPVSVWQRMQISSCGWLSYGTWDIQPGQPTLNFWRRTYRMSGGLLRPRSSGQRSRNWSRFP